MHIGIVTSEFPPDIGGVETYAVEFAKALAEIGYRVSVFVNHRHSPISLAGIEILPILKFSKRIDSITLSQYDVDAWHVMNAAHSWLALETDKPVVVSIHGNDFLNPYPLTCKPMFADSPLWRLSKFLRPLDIWLGKKLTARNMQRALPKARVILSNSRYTEQVFLAKYPECEGKTLVAQVGVSRAFLNPPLIKKNNPTPQLLTVSRLSELRKNVDKVLEALSRLKLNFDFHYTVIGDGAFKSDLEDLAQRLGVSENVDFVGRLPMEQVIDAMCQADLFILPSSILADSHEGFGIVYLEAAACGTPSLATRQAGAIEAIKDGESGFFVDEPTVDSIQIELKKFLEGNIQFQPETCRAFAESFTWHRVVQKALPFYLPESSL